MERLALACVEGGTTAREHCSDQKPQSLPERWGNTEASPFLHSFVTRV